MSICHGLPRPLRRWFRLVCCPLLVAAGSWLALAQIAAHDNHGDGGAAAVALLLSALVCWAGIVTGLGTTAWRMSRHLRLLRGVRRRHRNLEEAMGVARVLQLGLLAGRQITPLTVWGLVLQPGETAHLDLPVDLQLRVAIANQTGRVIVTDRRLLCEGADGWVSLWYRAIVGFYPDIDRQMVVLDLADLQRIRLEGGAALLIAVYVTFWLYGQDGLRNHPALRSLDRVTSPPITTASTFRRSS